MRPRLRAACAGLFSCAALACGHPRSSGPARAPSASALPPLPPGPPDAHANGPLASPAPNEALGLTAIDQPTYRRAHDLARAGHVREAKRLFAHLILAYPDRAALVDDYNAVSAQLAAASAASRASLEARTPTALPAPPAVYTLAHATRDPALPVPKLAIASQARNQIIDDEAWFAKNGLHSPEYFLPPQYDVFFAPGALSTSTVVNALSGFSYTEYAASARFLETELPAWVPLAYGSLSVSRVIDSAPMTVAIYGTRVLAVFDEKGQARALYDFEAWVHPPASRAGRVKVGEVSLTTKGQTQSASIELETHTISFELVWALVRGGTLYVEHRQLAYAKETKGENAYVSALDLDSGELAWRSAPLVANASQFVLVGGGVVCGYGFTAEPDFVRVLDASSGAVRQKIGVKTGPEWIVAKGEQLFVRTYDTDVVMSVR